MVKIVGNLRPEDDYTHAPGAEPNFNESMYFNFFDPVRSVGGFLRLGNRPNEGYAEMTATVFLPDGRVLFSFARPQITDNAAFDAGGMRFEVLEPGVRLRTSYIGSAVELREPREMADPRRAFTENPRRHLTIELLHTAVGPLYGRSDDPHEAGEDADRQFAKSHYEQHMHASGSIDIEGAGHEIDGYGLRDHSWGPRSWQAIDGYEWLTMNFGADLGAMVSVIRKSPTEVRTGGVLVRGDTIDAIREVTIDIDYEPNGLYHRSLRVRARTEGGEDLDINGAVKQFLPLRNRRGERTTHIGEGMTEWRLGERVGYGLSELLRQA